MAEERDERGITLLELILALGVVALVLAATLLSPALGVQAALAGISILMNLRPLRRP